MKKKNSKQTLRKVNLDAFELRFSEEKLEIESKSLGWKTVVSSVSNLYRILLHHSNSGEEGTKAIEIYVSTMYAMTDMCEITSIISAASNLFNLANMISLGGEIDEAKIDELLELNSTTNKETFMMMLSNVKKLQEQKVSKEEDDEILEEERIMENLKQEEK